MERNRDGRRGIAGGGPVPAPRRPRTSGHKDSSVGDEDDMLEDGHNVKAREKPKKDNCGVASMQGMLGSSMLGSRNKRKKNGLQEPRNSTPDEVEEMTEDTDAGASEDDDDQPPPIARKPIKVRKSHEETIPVDLLAVPRKARTSMQKRCQESPPPPVNDTVQHSPVPSSTPSSAIKAGKRLKSSGVKSRPIKLPKATIPSSISEQEVEVAEALLKMVTNHSFADFKMEAKSEFKFDQKLSGERTGGGNSSTMPASSQANATAPLSPHGTSVLPMAEAPKRKRPRVRSRPEEGSRLPSFLSSSIGGTMSGDADHLQLSTGLANDTLAGKGEAEDADQPLPSNRYPPTMPSDMPTSDFHVSNTNTMGVPVTSGSLTLEAVGDRSNTPVAAECNIELLDRSTTSSCKVESDMATKSFTCTESLVKLELGKRSPELVENNRPPKFEIDLMASPIPDEKFMDNMEVAGKDAQDKRVVANTNPILDLEDHKQIQAGKELEKDLKQTGMKHAHGNALKDQERDQAAKQILEKNLEGVKSETKAAQKLERSVAATVASAAASFLASVSTAPSCTFSSTTNSDVINPPSANMWPGLLSPFAYFSAAAAAAGWPASFATDPNNSTQIQLPSSYPAIHSQSRWKRCAFHVHIARYIEIQQQLARHPFVYANPASLFGAKPYNINAPLDGNSANVTSGGIFTGGSTVTSAAATGTSERDANGGIGQQAKDRTAVESSRKQSNNQQPSIALQAGVPLSFSVTQGASSTHPTNLLSGNSGSGASVSNSGDTKVLITAPGTANAVVDMTPAQAQYLQAVMQQNSFPPFSFPFANISQQHGITQQQLNMQAAQFVGSPYYNARLVHSSQAHLSTQKQPGSRAEKESNATGESLTNDGTNSSSQAVEFAMLGAKQASKSHQLQASSNLQVQQQSVSLPPPLQQLTTGTSSLHMKGLESQASQAFPAMSVSTIAKGSVGRGPLGLAPVAAIMAPQGHAMLQNVPDAVRGNSHGQQHHPFSQSGQFYQQLHPAQGQKTSGVTDANRVTAESIIYGTASMSNGGNNSKGRDSPEGKVTMKRPQGTSTSTRVDIEAGPNFQGSPTRSSSRNVQASRVMTSGSSLNQSLSPAMRQSGHGLPGNGPSLTKQASARPNLINKFLTNQSAMPASQALRQADASAQVPPSQVQIRPAQRPLPPQNMSLGNSAQAVLGPAAMIKNQSQQPRNQQVVANARSSTTSASHSSGTVPLPPLSKPVITPVLKSAAGNKVTYSPSQKLQSNSAGKRSSPTSSPNAHVSSSNTAAQALPLKSIFPPLMRPTQQQGQYGMQSLMQSTPQQQQQLASSHSSSQHRYQQQVAQQQKHQHTEMQYRQQQFLMQQQYYQQQTSQSPPQSIVYQSSQTETHPVNFGLQQHVLAHSSQQQQQHSQQSHEHPTSLPSSAVLGGGNLPSSLSLGPNISASNSMQAVTSEGVMSAAKPNVSSNTKVGSSLQMRPPQKNQPGTMSMLPQFGSPNPETTASNFMQQGPKLLPVVRPPDGTIIESNGAGTNARLSTNITSFSHPQSPLRSQSGGNGSGKSSQISPNISANTPLKVSTPNIASPVSTSQANPGGQLQAACSQQLAAAPVVAGPVASPVITVISGGSTGNGK